MINELDDIKTVTINGLSYDLNQQEFDYLMKFEEDLRLSILCSLRYEFNVLEKQGKKKDVDTQTRIKSRTAIRFACEFVKHGMGKSK